jgi:hypothetical protein
MNPDDMIELLSGPLTLRRRIAIVTASLGGLATATLTALLWATEPGLPLRTQVAFGAIIVVGLAWVGYGLWALTYRFPLFARDRVVAAWLGVAACGLLAVPMGVVTIVRDRMQVAALVTILVLVVLATANLVHARAHRAALVRRKAELGG